MHPKWLGSVDSVKFNTLPLWKKECSYSQSHFQDFLLFCLRFVCFLDSFFCLLPAFVHLLVLAQQVEAFKKCNSDNAVSDARKQ